jgi:uncharacterized protein YqjF (DUF2071 family)
MRQSWVDLMFAHWRVAPELLAPLVPAPLELETFDGTAWLGVAPFVVTELRPRLLPPLPGLAAFREANVRTYVRFRDRPGVLFLTLEASSRAAVTAARLVYRLPYHHARMGGSRSGDWVRHASDREGLHVAARFAPGGPHAVSGRGTLEEFLVERYCLYTSSAGLVWRSDIDHPPWRLAPAAEGSSIEARLPAPLTDLSGPPLLHVAARQDVLVWPLVPVARVTSRRSG